MTRFARTLAGLFVLATFVLPLVGMAAFDPTKGLVPECQGSSCELCHLVQLGNSLIDFVIIYISWPVAAVLFAYAGFLYITSQGNPGQTGQARSIFTNVAIGFIIVLAAWIVIDAIMGSLVNPNNVNLGQPWHTIECVGTSASTAGTGGTGGVSVVPAGSSCTPGGQNFVNGFDTCDPAVQNNINNALQNPEGTALRQTTPVTGRCSLAALQPLDAALNQAVANNPGVDKTLLQAIVLKESGGNINIPDGGAGEIGPGQVLPSTALKVVPALQGKSTAEAIVWLRNPTNNMQATAAILLKNGGQNTDPALLAAAYNGGPAAIWTSVNCCVGVSNCQVKRYQCPWNNNAQTVPNTGYAGTRNVYVPTVTTWRTQIMNGQCT